jgi:hypothetical protein
MIGTTVIFQLTDQDIDHTVRGAATHRADQCFGQGQRAGGERAAGLVAQECGGTSVVRVCVVEVGDQDRRVEDDHSGHSWCNDSR